VEAFFEKQRKVGPNKNPFSSQKQEKISVARVRSLSPSRFESSARQKPEKQIGSYKKLLTIYAIKA